MEEYIEKLISQIRCKKARPYVADEIRGHMEDQIADNEELGMSREEAEKNAVLDMGDPVAVGVSMDRIHKPQISVKLLVIIGLRSSIRFFQRSIQHRRNLAATGHRLSDIPARLLPVLC